MLMPAQEPDTLPLRGILIATALAVAVIVVGTALSGLGEKGGDGVVVARPGGTLDRGLFEGHAPGIEREESARASLDHYSWIDRDAGIAAIPVERAIDIVASKPQ